MRRLLLRFGLVAGLAMFAGGSPAQAAPPPFRAEAGVSDGGTLELRFDIAPGYYLYRDRFEFRVAATSTTDAQLGPIVLPQGRHRPDGSLGTEVELLAGRVAVQIPIVASDGRVQIDVGYQGCTELGVCLAPRHGVVDAEIRGGRVRSAWWHDGAAPASGRVSPRIEAALQSGTALWLGAVFFGAGVLLSLTPCMLPMVPILASIIAGQEARLSRARGTALALSYTFGMAAVYTALGLTAGLLGEGLAGLLQNPWTLGAFAVLLAFLSLSMFGMFELQLAARLQERLSAASNRLPGGRMTGVFAMGGLSALLVGPCVAPPLAGALLFIGRTQDVVRGGVALFCLALGMCVPLLAVGASAGSLLPHAGPWMERVKQALGAVLLAVALWMLQPAVPGPWLLGAAGLLLIGGAAVWARRRPRQAPVQPVHSRGACRIAPLLLALAGAALLAAPWVSDWVGAARSGRPVSPADGAGFNRLASAADFDATLRAAGRPVVVFFSAEWCFTCAQLERQTLRDASVRSRLDAALNIRIDLTLNDAAERALLRRFRLFGPPAVLFFQADGQEVTEARVIGLVGPEAFLLAAAAAGL